MKNKVHDLVQPSRFSPLSSPSSSTPSADSMQKNISSVINLLPRDLQDFTSILSLKEKEALAYLTKWNDSSYKKSNSKKSAILKPHEPSFKCDCSECSSSFRGVYFDSDNYDLMHQILVSAIEHKNSKKMGKRTKKKGKKVQEHSAEQPGIQECRLGSSGNGGMGLQRSGRDVIEETLQETEVVSWPQGSGRSHVGYGRKIFPDMVGILNSSWWRLWHPIVKEEEEGN